MTDPAQPSRLRALDALRGFDMFWIIGGGALVEALSRATGWPLFRVLAEQQEHAAWNGFRFEDLIFPLFLFIAGVTVPFSLLRDLERGASKASVHRRILRRALLLVLLGLVYQGILQCHWADQRYCSVLARIGLAWAGAALLAVHCRPRGQALWGAALLLGLVRLVEKAFRQQRHREPRHEEGNGQARGHEINFSLWEGENGSKFSFCGGEFSSWPKSRPSS